MSSIETIRFNLKNIFITESSIVNEEEIDAGHTDPSKNDVITVDLTKHMSKLLDHIKGLQADPPKYDVQKNEATDELEVVDKKTGEPDKAPPADGTSNSGDGGDASVDTGDSNGISSNNEKSSTGKSGVDTKSVIKFIATLGKDNLKQITELPDDAKIKLKDAIISSIKKISSEGGSNEPALESEPPEQDLSHIQDKMGESLSLLADAYRILKEDERTGSMRQKIKKIFGEASTVQDDDIGLDDLDSEDDSSISTKQPSSEPKPLDQPKSTTDTQSSSVSKDESKSEDEKKTDGESLSTEDGSSGEHESNVEKDASTDGSSEANDSSGSDLRSEMANKLQSEYDQYKEFIKKSGIDISKKPFVAKVLDIDDTKETAHIVLMVRDKERAESGKSNYTPKDGIEITIPWSSVSKTVVSAKQKPGLLKRIGRAMISGK